MTSASSAPGRKFGGLLTRRERWGLSWRGWLAAGVLAVGAATGFVLGVYPFFAITERVDTRLLAMEGFIEIYAVQATAAEFRSRGYERVFTTGGPESGMGGYTNDDNTLARVGAGRLKKAGVPADLVQMVPSRVLARDRTYSSALALKEWCTENGVPLRRINVVTADVHARRTRLLFQKALGPDVEVGIISVPHPDYDARRWWYYSQGVRAVIGESIAYVYARLFLLL